MIEKKLSLVLPAVINCLIAFMAGIGIFTSTAHAAELHKQILKITVAGHGEMSAEATWETSPLAGKTIQFSGKILGHSIGQSYSQSDLEKLKTNHQSQVLLKHNGQSVLLFSPGSDFDLSEGGAIQVGYLAGLGNTRHLEVVMKYDTSEQIWYLEWTKPGTNEVHRLTQLNVKLKEAPIVGPVGISSLTGTDPDGHSFKVN